MFSCVQLRVDEREEQLRKAKLGSTMTRADTNTDDADVEKMSELAWSSCRKTALPPPVLSTKPMVCICCATATLLLAGPYYEMLLSVCLSVPSGHSIPLQEVVVTYNLVEIFSLKHAW